MDSADSMVNMESAESSWSEITVRLLYIVLASPRYSHMSAVSLEKNWSLVFFCRQSWLYASPELNTFEYVSKVEKHNVRTSQFTI